MMKLLPFASASLLALAEQGVAMVAMQQYGNGCRSPGFLAMPLPGPRPQYSYPEVPRTAYGYHNDNPAALTKETITVYHGTSWEACKQIGRTRDYKMKAGEGDTFGRGVYTSNSLRTPLRWSKGKGPLTYFEGCLMEITLEVSTDKIEVAKRRGEEGYMGRNDMAFDTANHYVKQVKYAGGAELYYIINEDNAHMGDGGVFTDVSFFYTGSWSFHNNHQMITGNSLMSLLSLDVSDLEEISLVDHFDEVSFEGTCCCSLF